MKVIILALALLISNSALAGVVSINSNIFSAAGPATANYFANIIKIENEVRKLTSAELGLFAFNGALVDSESNTTQYHFHRLEKSDKLETCWVNISFTVKENAEGPLFSKVSATLDCHQIND